MIDAAVPPSISELFQVRHRNWGGMVARVSGADNRNSSTRTLD
jgi:hypothetical protein